MLSSIVAVILIILGLAAIGVLPGILTFCVIKHLFRRPGDLIRIISGLISAGIAACIALLFANLVAQDAGEGNLYIAAALKYFGAPVLGISAFIFGLGMGQSPKSDWIG